MEKLVEVKSAGDISMKDAQLREAFKEQLASGLPFIAAITEPKKSEKDGGTYFQLSVIQQVVEKRKVDALDELLLDYGKKVTIERTFRNVNLGVLSARGKAVVEEFTTLGNTLSGRSLEIHHSIVKPYENATPINIANGETGEIEYLLANAGQATEELTINKVNYPSVITKGGELVYKSVKLVTGEPTHVKLQMTRVPESKFKGIQANLQSVDSMEFGDEVNI